MKQKIAEKFQTLFQTEGEFFASAGRINLIGEHTDYNGGFVFPGAIDKGMIAEIRLNGTQTVKAFALDLDEYCEFGLNEEDAPSQSWARYIFGVCREIQKRGGVIAGFDTNSSRKENLEQSICTEENIDFYIIMETFQHLAVMALVLAKSVYYDNFPKDK